jgi:hypothetical protein
MADQDYSDLLPGLSPDEANQLITNTLKKQNSDPSGSVAVPTQDKSSDTGLWPYALGAAGGAAVKGAAALAGKVATAKGLGTLATMAGPMAKFANQRKLDSFRNSSTTPERAYDSTGWFYDASGNPRFELSDVDLKSKPIPKPSFGGVSHGTLEDFVHWPKTFSNYPDARKIDFRVDPSLGNSNEATLEFEPYPRITVGGKVGTSLDPDQLASIPHEGQHFISEVMEGGHRGSTPEDVRQHVINLLLDRRNSLFNKGYAVESPEQDDIINMLSNANKRGYLMYKGLPGETEARNSSDRFFRQVYGRPTASPWGPQTTDINQVMEQFRKQGLVLEPQLGPRNYSELQRPVGYTITSMKNSRYPIRSENLSRDLRSMYDRLPIESGSQYPIMAGEFKYPWKSEDLPRSQQRDWTVPQSYNEIHKDWLDYLRR